MITMQMVLAEQQPPVAATADEDAVLVKRAKKDLRAFSTLYDRHADRIYRYLLVRVNNVHDAQDLTSQTFIAAMENIHKYKGNSPFAAWLFGIARHKSVDHFRRNKPETILDAAANVPDDVNPDEIVGRQLQVELVARKLGTLSPDRAEALSLRLFGGLEAAEIARLMDKQESAVRMLVYRGLQDLQAQLNSEREVWS